MKPIAYIFSAFALLSLTATAQTAEFRVGFVSTDRVFRETKAALQAQEKLEKEFSKREKELADLAVTTKAASDKLERDAPTMSESQRASRQRQLAEQDRDFQRKRREFQEDLNQRKAEEQQALLERANRIVKQVADAEKYDLVLQEVVYINPKHDITDKIIKALDSSVAKAK
jgi:outer membrane protein